MSFQRLTNSQGAVKNVEHGHNTEMCLINIKHISVLCVKENPSVGKATEKVLND